MNNQGRVYAESWEARKRLAQLEIEEFGLTDAVQRGFVSSASCTENHPKSFAGLSLWGETTGALRENLSLVGWSRSDDQNQPLALNPAGQLAVTVATGTKETGRKDATPVTQSAKGPQTVKAVRDNNQYRFAFYDQIVRRNPVQVGSGCDLWILLVHCDQKDREVRSELSRPINMTAKGFVDEWSERIILPPIEFDGDTAARSDLGPETESPVIDFEIKRRVGS